MKLFGLPILLSIVAGVIFPYTAISLLPYGFVFLFILMLLSGLTIDWPTVPHALRRPWPLVLGLFLCFIFFPLLQLLLARLLLTDSQFIGGLLFGALMPPAMVAPFFTRLLRGDEEISFLLMVAATLIAPLVAPLLLKLGAGSLLPIEIAPMMKSMLLMVTLPLLGGFLIARYLPQVRKGVEPWLGVGNMAALSVLIFIMFGTAVGRLNLGYETPTEIGKLLGLAFLQDFGVLLAARFLLPQLLEPREATAVLVTLAMKNVAIACGVLFFYDPRAALPPALVFVAHACLFSLLPAAGKWLAVRPTSEKS
jgi:BASS family bile acid:Na+ symporter